MDNYRMMLNPKITMFMLKPDGVSRNLDDIIKKEISKAGFKVLAIEKKFLSKEDIKQLYQTSFRRDFPLGENDERTIPHIKFMQRDECLAYLVEHTSLEGSALYAESKKFRGDHWLPWKSNPESIRFRYFLGDKIEPIFSPEGYLLTTPPDNILHATLSDEEFNVAFDVFFKNMLKRHNYSQSIPAHANKQLDLILVATFSNSSSDKFKIKEHTGIAQLHAYIQSQGFTVDIDAFADEDINKTAEYLIKKNPRVIGFTAVASEFSYIKRLSSKIREIDKSILLVAGGPHFGINPYDIGFTDFDGICVGEGEFPLAAFLKTGKFDNINGWVYRMDDKLIKNASNTWMTDLSKLPLADHSLWNKFETQAYNHKRIVISRGCPFLCTYCSNEALSAISSGKYVRFRNAQSIQQEIDCVLDEYPDTECIFLESEALIPKLADIDGIVDITKKYSSKLYFGTNVRIGTFNENFLKTLRSGGFTFVNLGLESGSERIRKEVLHRHYSNDQVIDVFKMARKNNLQVNTYNMVGLPTETAADFEQTIQLNTDCGAHEAQVAIFFPYPGTELYFKSLEAGYLKNPFFYHTYEGKERRDVILEQPQLPRNQVLELYAKFRSIFG